MSYKLDKELQQKSTLLRQWRAMKVAKNIHIKKVENGWKVPSESGKGTYSVKRKRNNEFTCECKDFELRRQPCKHIWAVKMKYFKRECRDQLIPNIKKQFPPPTSFDRDWVSYDKATKEEKLLFMRLSHELCVAVSKSKYKGKGRPQLPKADLLFLLADKDIHWLVAEKVTRRVKTFEGNYTLP